jgi:hypothetical protein
MTLNTSDSLYYEDFSNKKLTASTISKGAVLGYFGYPASAGDTIVENTSEFTAIYGVQQVFSVGSLEVDALSDLSYTSTTGFLYRYVIIPGNVLANTSLKNLSKDQLSRMSFTDVTKAVNAAAQGSTGNRLNTTN